MWKLSKPAFSASEVYEVCAGSIRDRAQRAKMQSYSSRILQAEQEFCSKIEASQLHTITPEASLIGIVSSAELVKVYTSSMVGTIGGRRFYDAILNSAQDSLCPFCCHGDAFEIDHYLPKALFPRLSIVPVNLLPCCSNCNELKDDYYPDSAELALIHPYFDDISLHSWLRIRVNRNPGVSCTFFVDRPAEWDNLLYSRVVTHFRLLELNKIYSIQAARLLAQIKGGLESDFESEGALGVARTLKKDANSRAKVNRNSWQTAFYSGLLEDEWFCSEGFRHIGV